MTFVNDSVRAEIDFRGAQFEYSVSLLRKGQWKRESHGVTMLLRDVLQSVRQHSPALANTIAERVRPGRIGTAFTQQGAA